MNYLFFFIVQATEVGNWVLKVTAEDMDISPEYNTVTYMIVITFILVQ